MKSYFTSICLFSLAFSPSLASAERPKGQVFYTAPSAQNQQALAAPALTTNVVFLNRCEGGCTVSRGADDSIENKTSIVDKTYQLSEFRHSDKVWNEVLECVRYVYAPFNIVVTDQDPGNVPHFEAMIAGVPEDIGWPAYSVGGLGIGGCGEPINNSISMTFANLSGPDAKWLCYVAAQETGHNFGLDHEMLKNDPMTYLSYDGWRYFQDEAGRCGEQQERNCCVGARTQNTYKYLMDTFGPAGEVNAPELSVMDPAEGDAVEPGFAISIGVSGWWLSNLTVTANGRQIAAMENGDKTEYSFQAPDDLPTGPLELTITATDLHGNVSVKTLTVMQQEASDDQGGCSVGKTSKGTLLPWLALLLLAWKMPAPVRQRALAKIRRR